LSSQETDAYTLTKTRFAGFPLGGVHFVVRSFVVS
jgi:hypothetical protein